jgi:hypothetical protein
MGDRCPKGKAKAGRRKEEGGRRKGRKSGITPTLHHAVIP